jgi:hypothetical protein
VQGSFTKSTTKDMVLKAGKHNYPKGVEEETGVIFEKTGSILLKTAPE